MGCPMGIMQAALLLLSTSYVSCYSCLSPELLADFGIPAPKRGAAATMATVRHPQTGEKMEVPIKIALNGWMSGDLHSYITKFIIEDVIGYQLRPLKTTPLWLRKQAKTRQIRHQFRRVRNLKPRAREHRDQRLRADGVRC